MVGFGKDFGATRCPPSAPHPPTCTLVYSNHGLVMRRGPWPERAPVLSLQAGSIAWCSGQSAGQLARSARNTAHARAQRPGRRRRRVRAQRHPARHGRDAEVPVLAAAALPLVPAGALLERSDGGGCSGCCRLLLTRTYERAAVSVRLSVLSRVLSRLVQRWQLTSCLGARASVPHVPLKTVRHGEGRRGGGLPAGDPAAVVAHALTAARQSFRARLRQEVRRGARALRGFQVIVEGLLAELRAGGPPAPGDVTIGAHLLRMRDPATGRPLTDAQLLPEARRRPPPLSPPPRRRGRARAVAPAGLPRRGRAAAAPMQGRQLPTLVLCFAVLPYLVQRCP